MKYLFIVFSLLSLMMITSCCNDTEVTTLDCDKLQSREEAEELMSSIYDKKYNSIESIRENLIGEWGLIGLVPGWRSEFGSFEACIHLTITEDSILMMDINTGIDSTMSYEIIRTTINTNSGFYLDTNQDPWNSRIGTKVFSEDLMYGSEGEDANIYIYEKLQ